MSEGEAAIACSWLARVLLAIQAYSIADEDRIAAEACSHGRHASVLIVGVGSSSSVDVS